MTSTEVRVVVVSFTCDVTAHQTQHTNTNMWHNNSFRVLHDTLQVQPFVSHDVTAEAHHHPPHPFAYHWMLHSTGTEFSIWNSQSLLQIWNRCSKGFCILYSWYEKCPTVYLTQWLSNRVRHKAENIHDQHGTETSRMT